MSGCPRGNAGRVPRGHPRSSTSAWSRWRTTRAWRRHWTSWWRARSRTRSRARRPCTRSSRTSRPGRWRATRASLTPISTCRRPERATAPLNRRRLRRLPPGLRRPAIHGLRLSRRPAAQRPARARRPGRQRDRGRRDGPRLILLAQCDTEIAIAWRIYFIGGVDPHCL